MRLGRGGAAYPEIWPFWGEGAESLLAEASDRGRFQNRLFLVCSSQVGCSRVVSSVLARLLGERLVPSWARLSRQIGAELMIGLTRNRPGEALF